MQDTVGIGGTFTQVAIRSPHVRDLVHKRVDRLQAESAKMKLAHKGGLRGPRSFHYSLELSGAFGEAAVALALGVAVPTSVNKFRSPDVAGLWVRTTTWLFGRLKITSWALGHVPDAKFVLVIDRDPYYYILGWCTPTEASKVGEWEDKQQRGSPCWWVPQTALHDFGALAREGLRAQKDIETEEDRKLRYSVNSAADPTHRGRCL